MSHTAFSESDPDSFIHHHLNYFLPTIYTITDWVMILLAEFLAYHLRGAVTGNTHFHMPWLNFWVAFPLLFLLFFRQGGIYTKHLGYWKLLETIFRACTYAAGAIVVFVYLSHISASTSRLFVGLLWIFSIILVTLFRYFFAHVLNWAGVGSVPVLLVGAGKTARLVLQGIRDDIGLNFNVIGYVDDAGPQEENVGNLPYLGPFGQVVEVIEKTQVQDVCIAVPGMTPEKLNQLIHVIQPHVRNLSFVPDLIGLPVNGIEVDSLFNERLMFMSLKNNLARPYNRVIKRIFDLVLTTIGVVLLSPIFLLLAILIKLDSRGPVIFAHKRIGKGGKLFPCLKFRTMCVDADQKLKEYLAANPEARKEWEAEFKLKDDPRVTRVGESAAENQPGRTAPAVQRAHRPDEPGGAPAHCHGGDSQIRTLHQGLLHGPSRHHRHVAGERPQRHHLRRTGPDGLLVRPQLGRMAGYHAAVEDVRGSIAA